MLGETRDYSDDTWQSLLGLLRPFEYLVTLDNCTVWHRHLAWAKTDGAALRSHVIQRFSSNMVFLSLMMGSSLMVLFNSSQPCAEMRQAVAGNEWLGLKFWIGVTIIVSVCVTISALVATFTAWGMVSAISDNNVHCVLRSSIGQYVCHLPSRLVVSSLYIFLLWIVLWTIELTTGFVAFLLVAVIMTVFLQVVVSFSAFGRLIVHTGAMGKKRVLDEELERALLPSGLHASLLIKATDHQRRRTSVICQYKSPNKNGSFRSSTSMTSMDVSSMRSHRSTFMEAIHEQGSTSSDLSSRSGNTATPSPPSQNRVHAINEFSAPTASTASTASKLGSSFQPSRKFANEVCIVASTEPSSSESDEDSIDPGDVVQLKMKTKKRVSIDTKTMEGSPTRRCRLLSSSSKRQSVDPDDLQQIQRAAGALTRQHQDMGEMVARRRSSQESSRPTRRRSSQEIAFRQSQLLGAKRMSSKLIVNEWEAEFEARGVYDAEPPADLVQERELDLEEGEEDFDPEAMDASFVFPRASLLNKSRRLQSLRDLASGGVSEEHAHTGTATKRRETVMGSLMVPVTSFFRAVSFGPDPNDSYGDFGDSTSTDVLNDLEEVSTETDHLLHKTKGSESNLGAKENQINGVHT